MEQEGGGASAWATPFLESPYDFRHPPPKNAGTGARRLPLGIRNHAEVEGVRSVYRTQSEVAGTTEQMFLGPRFKFY
jgi:hypothetical protein